MANEVELKLSLPEFAVPALLAMAEKDDLPLGVSQGEPLQLDNQYFDTEDLALNQSHAALRIRKSQYGFKQTLKNKGQAIGGLHQRGEWEYDIDQAEINWQLFPKELNIDPALKDAIKPLFKTDFTRHVWLKQFAESKIEVVLDQGCIQNDHKRYPLCEIELELVSGRAEDLFDFALTLSKRFPLVPCDINKAERGYGLDHHINFYSAPNFSTCFFNAIDLSAFLQDALTRINRHWDHFSQSNDWWSMMVLSRDVQSVVFVLSSLKAEECHQDISDVLNCWVNLKQELIDLITPAQTVIALFVDEHSHSRGLSQRLLQNLTGELNEKILEWINKNTLGNALLFLGNYLYRVDKEHFESTSLNNAFWKDVKHLQSQALDMPVAQFQDLESIQTLAYLYKRFQLPVYHKINQVVHQQLVVMGMADALDIRSGIDNDSRAKLASWSRRVTVERRRLQALREELNNALMA